MAENQEQQGQSKVMGNESVVSQQLEESFINHAYKPKPKVRDTLDLKYIEKSKHKNNNIKNTDSQDPSQSIDFAEFVPNQELKMKKEQYKRENLFAKQIVQVIKLGIINGTFQQYPEENQLKWNLKQYKKYGKSQGQLSAHMKMANLDFNSKGKSKQQDENQSQQEVLEENQQEQKEDLAKSQVIDGKQKVYLDVFYAKQNYKTEPLEPVNTISETGVENLYEFEADWKQDFEFTKSTETMIHFQIKELDTNINYNQRYSWLKNKYNGDTVIGEGKIDLASVVIGKNKRKEKKVIVKNPQNQEKIGFVNIEIDYIDSDFQKPEEIKLECNYKVENLKVDFSKVDTSKLEKKFKEGEVNLGDLVPFAKIRMASQNYKTDYQPGTSITSQEAYKFNVPDETMKVVVEIHLYNEQTKFTECIGVSKYQLSNQNKPDPMAPFDPIVTQVQSPLFYKGQIGGESQFQLTKYQKPPKKQKQYHKYIDVKELGGKLSEKDEWLKAMREKKQELFQQKYHELNLQKINPQKNFLTPQLPKKESVQVIKLPKINQKEQKPIQIRAVKDRLYDQSIRGVGFSNCESSSTLQRSVPHFSIPKSKRFEFYDTGVPGPNKYSSIGILENIKEIDNKLQKKRQRDFDDYQKYKNQNAVK